MTDLSQRWIERDHDVTLITEHDQSTDAYAVHPQVRRVILESGRTARNLQHLLSAVRALRIEIRRTDPQVLVSLGAPHGLIAGLAALGLRCRSVIFELGVPWQVPTRKAKWIRHIAYGFADAVACRTEAVGDWLEKHPRVRRSCVIPRSVRWPIAAAAPETLPDSVCPRQRKLILAASRLAPEKNLAALIRAFAVVVRTRPDWTVVILGDGPCRQELERQIAALGLEDKVLLPGRAGNIGIWYQRASLFALSSLHEGGPNSLVEALAYGVPVLSFDCDAGPRTIIRHGVDGILVPPADDDALSDGLRLLMDDAQLRADMGLRALEARERFSEEKCLQAWDDLFRALDVS